MTIRSVPRCELPRRHADGPCPVSQGRCGARRARTLLFVERTAKCSASHPRLIPWLCLVLTVSVSASACGSAESARTAPSNSPHKPSLPRPSAPLSAPKASVAQESQYLTDVTEVDPALETYVRQQSDVALRTFLTDGSAFCAFLKHGGGIDTAMVSVAIGARSVESKTHLPLTVKTFNAVDAVALLALCPAEQQLVPASDRARIRNLDSALAKHAS